MRSFDHMALWGYLRRVGASPEPAMLSTAGETSNSNPSVFQGPR